MKFLKLFQTHEDYEDFVSGGTMVRPNVSHCVSDNEVHYNPSGWQYEYLTFVALEDGTFKFSTYDENIISYSVDEGKTWTELSANTDSPTVTAGNKIMWKGELTKERWNSGIGNFISTGPFDVQGNVMSLLCGDDFNNETCSLKTYIFSNLFSGQPVINAKNLVLPATMLANYCYQQMFFGCTNLTSAPELPATTLANYCYQAMFYNCTSLTTEPALPATTLAGSCYDNMFFGCTNLTSAPVLPATTLAENCYHSMFYGCASLTTVPELPATTLTLNCYNGMFQDCTNLIVAPVLSARTVGKQCCMAMFSGCTSLTTAPELPATVLAEGCYRNMFAGCTSLTAAPELPATTLANLCYYNMFSGCTAITVSPELPATTLAQSCYSGMFENTNVLPDCSNIDFTSETVVGSGGLRGLFEGTKVTDSDLDRILPKNANGKYCLPVMTLTSSCYISMFNGCANLTTAPELPATTLFEQCYYQMFQGCTSLTTAPVLLATTLERNSYSYMFNGCASLNYIKAMFTSQPNTNKTNNWVKGVATNGTFVKNAAATWGDTGVYAVPTGWTVERASA